MSTEQKRSGIKMKTASLAHYPEPISAPGIYFLPVASTVTEKNLVTSENGRKSYIVSLKAIADDKIGQVQQVFAGKEEVDIEDTNGCFMTGNIWLNEKESVANLPMKGEIVKVSVDHVRPRDGGEDEVVLRVREIQLMAPKATKKLNLLDFFASTEKTVVAPVGETLVKA